MMNAGRQLIELAEIPYMLSRPYVGPPNMPLDRAKALQAGARRGLPGSGVPRRRGEDARRRQARSAPQQALRMLERLADAPLDLKEEIRKLEAGGR